MINKKYYNDIKKFPSQFKEGFEIARNLKIDGNFSHLQVCGMGGSSFYVDIINNYLESKDDIDLRLEVNRSYHISNNKSLNEQTLFVLASYSGNTEEILSIMDEVLAKGYKYIVLSASGKLLERAKENNAVYFQIPLGLQPRLSTGYFIAGLMKILKNSGLIEFDEQEILKASEKINSSLDEEKTKDLAEKLVNKVPIIYSTDNNWSLARVSKIKFNENSKTQSFWNFFPELNHNEMVGFTNLVMDPYFIIFKSQFTHEKNKKRIEIFSKIMRNKSLPVEIIEMKGDNIFEEIMNAYYFIDHVTYYLAESYNIDPEPVEMVEEFKKMI